MLFAVRMRRVGRDHVADPSEHPTRANPEARCHDEPENRAQKRAVVDLSESRQEKRQHRGSSTFAHVAKVRRLRRCSRCVSCRARLLNLVDESICFCLKLYGRFSAVGLQLLQPSHATARRLVRCCDGSCSRRYHDRVRRAHRQRARFGCTNGGCCE